MKTELLASGVGIVVGVIFTLLKLPLPAPPVLAGVLGIVEIYAGFKLVELIKLFL